MAVVGYILVTSGPRDVSPKHPGAKRQVENLRWWAESKGAKIRLEFDYVRKIRGRRSLPKLMQLLESAERRGSTIVMDDTSRLFRVCTDDEAKSDILEALKAYGDRIVDLRQRGIFSNFIDRREELITSGVLTPYFDLAPRKRRAKPKEELTEQTAAANSASAKTRRRASREKAQQLADIRSEAKSAARPTRARAIADAANERGLTTTRGRPWRADTVSRLLRSYDDERQIDDHEDG